MKILIALLPLGAFADIMPPAAEPEPAEPRGYDGPSCCDPQCACTCAPEPEPKLTLKEKVQALDEDLKILTDRFAGIGREIEVTGTDTYATFPAVTTFSNALDYLSTRIRVLNSLAQSIESKLGI